MMRPAGWRSTPYSGAIAPGCWDVRTPLRCRQGKSLRRRTGRRLRRRSLKRQARKRTSWSCIPALRPLWSAYCANTESGYSMARERRGNLRGEKQNEPDEKENFAWRADPGAASGRPVRLSGSDERLLCLAREGHCAAPRGDLCLRGAGDHDGVQRGQLVF